ncbi:hypothetical protein [Alteromonas lipotrueiana]|uniref:hypothetical protein n=1 Tax=Alteromonas lipotrueiana TaxID=2803815 RepID=UPI001C43F6A6|nr:hypothetical protein [Alteromonas lipotrueiana]
MFKQSKNKHTTMLTVMAIFVLPVVLAKLALDNQWFNQGVTNKGELIQPVMDYSGYLSEQPVKWRLVYHLPAQCDDVCENAIYSIQQVWLALGRETDRAQPTILYSSESDTQKVIQLQREQNIEVLESPTMPMADRSTVLVVDTMNNAMLRYTISKRREQAILGSRDILADVRKLLKLSRIG